MHIKRFFRAGGMLLAMLVLCVMLLSAPAQASALVTQLTSRAANSASSVNAHIYLTNQALQPLFQSDLNAQLPQALGNAITSSVSTLPQQDQGWAKQMANALLQPSATLLGVTPQANGLLTTFRVSLYAGDPHPMTTSLLLGFSVRDASTLQVSALPPANGAHSLLSGPLTTVNIPIGSLQSVATTPGCGDAALNVGLAFPIASGHAAKVSAANSGLTMSGQPARVTSYSGLTMSGQRQNSFAINTQPTFPDASSQQEQFSTTSASLMQPASTTMPASIELPASSLNQLGGSMGTLTVGSNLTANNLRLGVQGHNLTISADISWFGLGIGTAVSTVAPGASSGKLAMHVQSTDLQMLNGLISFPVNSYNQQIEQTIDTSFNNVLVGKFTVAQAAIGGNAHLPCVASNSLVLTGTVALG